MVSLITSPTHLCFSRNPISHLTTPFISIVLSAKNKPETLRKPTGSRILEVKERYLFGLLEPGRRKSQGKSWWCWCTERWRIDYELESEILEVMENSPKPSMFPSKKELVEAGRLDLAEAIKKRGGWFMLGWELEDEEDEVDNGKEDKISLIYVEAKDLERRTKSCKGSGFLTENETESWSLIPSRNSFSENSSASASTSLPESSFGGSLEEQAENASGIEGILSRLENDRNSSFGITLGKSRHGTHASSNTPVDYQRCGNSRDVGTIHGNNGTQSIGSAVENPLSSSNDNTSHYTQPDQWRSWSLQRAGFDGSQFEADELPYSIYHMENGGMQEEMIGTAADASTIVHPWKESSHNQIQTHLRYLEMELASAFHLLRSRNEESTSKEGSCNDSQMLSDALEYQENEFMSNQERLRSIRAKLAVLEGKMELALKDVQNVLEEKQRRIDSASRTLQVLRTTSVVWTNSATEVLLAGSFDGWTSQRKMEKSRTGTFSVYLKLYPGKYEIKFIVDGIWKTDPLRPIVHNNGHENNILIIT